MKKTDLFTYNIRLSTVPGLTEEEYEKFMAGESVEVSNETKEYMIKYGYGQED